MEALAAGLLVGLCVFAGALLGLHANRVLPAAHLTKEAQDVVRLGTGTISVLASLVLGLLIATAKTASDTADHELRAFAADMILLDRTLRSYGTEAAAPADLLRRAAQRMLQDIWPRPGGRFTGLDDTPAAELLERTRLAIRTLTPGTDPQRAMQAEAVQLATGLMRQRWLLIEQAGPTIQPAVLAILVAWIVAIFAAFGLNAPRNATVVAAFLVFALSIGAAIFLVLEMDTPFQGLLRVSPQPIQRAIAHMAP